MARTHREKRVDVPPKGARNPDPITDQSGSHPIETGVGAALGGAAGGAALGAVAGPAGAVLGAAAGAIAGGLAGKEVGESIDPTTSDAWLREYVDTREKPRKGESYETYRPAYQYGIQSAARCDAKRFEDVEDDLKAGWKSARGEATLGWDRVRDATRDAFNRTIALREERLRVDKQPVETGRVNVRKEVVTDHQNLTVPVEREEVVIERRPAARKARTTNMKREEIRIPVKEEKVQVSKETVVTEDVQIGKRKVHDTAAVSEDVRHEELVVEQEGKARVQKADKKC